MAVSLNKEFWLNIGLCLFTLIALILSVISFVKSTKSNFKAISQDNGPLSPLNCKNNGFDRDQLVRCMSQNLALQNINKQYNGGAANRGLTEDGGVMGGSFGNTEMLNPDDE